jgi:hypothetical protein
LASPPVSNGVRDQLRHATPAKANLITVLETILLEAGNGTSPLPQIAIETRT